MYISLGPLYLYFIKWSSWDRYSSLHAERQYPVTQKVLSMPIENNETAKDSETSSAKSEVMSDIYTMTVNNDTRLYASQ